ncbi:cysteine hydrolase [Agromyces sp. MMS24-JH15]|uniref:cysteine hydrolase n=1 Tax=Agromyces sp. MMS24-JH15 TaxID=3243765 RepID=UPI003748A9B7
MPIELDERAALIVVDLQAGTVRNPFAHDIDGVIERATALAASFRAHGRPVVIARSTGMPTGRNAYGPGGARQLPADYADPAPGLQPEAGDLTVERTGWNALTDPLDRALRELGVTQVVVAGVATSFGIESTARAAYDRDYHVVLVQDAMTDMTEARHDGVVAGTFPILGQVAFADEVLALLDRA